MNTGENIQDSRKRQIFIPSTPSSYQKFKQSRLDPSNLHFNQMNGDGSLPIQSQSSTNHSRQSGEKRSRHGCQMCKKRRKKCPEDFQTHSNGFYGCSVCFQKGLECQPPSLSPEGGGGGNSRLVKTSLSTPLAKPSNVFASAPTLFPNNFVIPQQEQFVQPQSSNVNTANANANTNITAISHQPMPNEDAAWLNNFFQEFSNLSDPIYQDAMWLAGNHSVNNAHDAPSNMTTAANNNNNNSLFSSPFATATTNTPAISTTPPPPVQEQQQSSSSSETQRGRQEYDRIVESDELDCLLKRYSPLYEKVWRAAMSVSEKDADLMKEIIKISRFSKACRAASVAACLSLHHIMQRERDADRRSGRMGFVHILELDTTNGIDGGSSSPSNSSTISSSTKAARNRNGSVTSTPNDENDKSSWPTAEERVSLASKWYQFAFEEYGRSGKQDLMEQRLATLLNLRYTNIALSGARVGLACIDEIRKLISELGVNTDYMRNTSHCGTILGVMVQSVLVMDVFEAATKRHQRCALQVSSTKNGNNAPSSPSSLNALYGEVLAQDLRQGRLYEYEFTSCLSCDLLEGMLLICNLDADIHDGIITTETEKKVRIDEVENMIRQAKLVRKNGIEGTALVRSWAVHEMWRQAFLIKFYQRILKLGSLATKVQKALQEILSLADMLSSTLSPSETWDMWMVWFLASTVSITEEQRKKCILYLEAMGSEQAIIDNLVVIKQLWKASDETGYPQDWYSIAEQNNLSVCYAF